MPSSTDIIGHESQIEALRSDIASDNVAHAYLFAGKPHLGKFTVAKWFARELLTSDARDDADRTQLLREIDRLLHPDLLVIDQLWMEDICEDFDVLAKSSNVPQQHRAKAGAKTDTISVDDVRALQDRLHEVSTGRFRCCLIRGAERMQAEAVNTLLKIVEEPPPGVVFLLTTESASALLPTLVSRSRVVRFSPVPLPLLTSLVADASTDDAQFLLRLAQGAPGIILRMKADPDALRLERQQYASALAFWHASSLAERLQLLKPLEAKGEDAQRFLLHLALALREERGDALSDRAAALHGLLRNLKTNASRPLLAQKFAMEVG